MLQRIKKGKTVGKTEKAKSFNPEITAFIELCKWQTNNIIKLVNIIGIIKFLYFFSKIVHSINIKKHRIIVVITYITCRLLCFNIFYDFSVYYYKSIKDGLIK